MKLLGMTAIVTGAGRGIGKATALALAREGANLALSARTESELRQTGEEVVALGREALVVPCDVSNWPDVSRMAESVVERFGAVDVLVNNAGRITPIQPVVDTDPGQWMYTIAVNLGGVYYCCRAVLPYMMKRRAGKIINLSGGGAATPSPRFSSYGVSKAAVVRLTETLAEEVKEYNIQVNAIAPGAVYTKITEDILAAGSSAGERQLNEAQRVRDTGGASPDKAAELVVFLASHQSDGLTGRLLSAVWDDWQSMTPARISQIMGSEWYTLRRVVPGT